MVFLILKSLFGSTTLSLFAACLFVVTCLLSLILIFFRIRTIIQSQTETETETEAERGLSLGTEIQTRLESQNEIIRYLRRNQETQLLELALSSRDFSEQDYERLLSLDNETPTKILQRASQVEINRLPVRVISKNEELRLAQNQRFCSVCLSEFKENDVVKTLPCFHFFHQSCIEKWLKIKKKCPVCDSWI
ncbi:hypothetical protein M0811_09394 [Anaeramoeba ignava]|uniref:RING-type domain-containing protein n=1 Tax=Anaeramoeba ignava TaxID=1746090 RepID=A0A9Q0LH34_ANAIG|nr:hypothetical protein M0811_09394 [Anaeramoeba ignava]